MPGPKWPTGCRPRAAPRTRKAAERAMRCHAAATALPQRATMSAGGQPPRHLSLPIDMLRQGCSDRSMPKLAVHLCFALLALLAASPAGAQPQPAASPLSADERRCAGLDATPPDVQAQAC